MKLYSSLFSKFLRNSTAVSIMAIASAPTFAMDRMDEGEKFTKGYVYSSNYKAVPFELNPSINTAAIERDRWGKPKRITTDKNNLASYQLESNRFAVQPNDIIQISYKIRVLPDGKMSFGLLNTERNGWYGEECVLRNYHYAYKDVHEGTYEVVVPAGESIASLVFRNYHLGEPGQTIFTLEELDINKKEACWLNSTGHSKSVKQEANGPITVITDDNNWASYQLESNRTPVKPDNLLKTNYKFTVQPGGKVSMGYLSNSRTWWYGEEDVFGEGTHQGTFERFVPAEEKETSLVFRNYHLEKPGQSTFTIEYLDFQNEEQGHHSFTMFPKELIGLIFQNCSLQTIGRFSCASQEYKKLGNSPAIWAHRMKQYNYPTLTNCPDLRDATKFDFMAHHFEYAQFNKAEPASLENPITCTIKVKNLIRILDIFSPNAEKESYFLIGKDSFVLKQENRKVFLSYNGRIVTTEPTPAHSLECLNPEATVVFQSTGQWFIALIPVGLHTYKETKFNPEQDLYKKYSAERYYKEKSEGVYTPDPLTDYIQNRFYIQRITEKKDWDYFKFSCSFLLR